MCECDAGYERVGGRCQPRDVCRSGEHECDVNARCVFLGRPGEYQCHCTAGYSGDGKNCQGRNAIDN